MEYEFALFTHRCFLFPFFPLTTSPSDHSWHRYVSHPNPPPPPRASLSALRLSPRHTKTRKSTHPPTQDWRSDKIKNAQQLIWIKGARSIRIQKEVLSLTERQKGRSRFCRNGEQWRTTERCRGQGNLRFLWKRCALNDSVQAEMEPLKLKEIEQQLKAKLSETSLKLKEAKRYLIAKCFKH